MGRLESRFLASSLGVRRDLFPRFVFAVSFADLLLDFFDDDIDGGVEVAFVVFGEEVGSANAQSYRAGKLSFGHARVVVFERDARFHDAGFQVLQFVEFGKNVIFNSFRQSHIMRRKNPFHDPNMALLRDKIQPIWIYDVRFAIKRRAEGRACTPCAP